MSLSPLGSSINTAYSPLTPQTQTSTDMTNADTSSADTETAGQDPALAGSSNSLQALFALTQSTPGVTAALVSQVVDAALNAPSDSSTTVAQTFGVASTDFAPVAQPDATFSGSTAAATSSGTQSAAPATASVVAATTGAASLTSASSSSTTTTNSDGTETTTTLNADGSVTVETTGTATNSDASSSSANASSQASVDDSYLAYLSLPTISVDNSVDYSDT